MSQHNVLCLVMDTDVGTALALQFFDTTMHSRPIHRMLCWPGT